MVIELLECQDNCLTDLQKIYKLCEALNLSITQVNTNTDDIITINIDTGQIDQNKQDIITINTFDLSQINLNKLNLISVNLEIDGIDIVITAIGNDIVQLENQANADKILIDLNTGNVVTLSASLTALGIRVGALEGQNLDARITTNTEAIALGLGSGNLKTLAFLPSVIADSDIEINYGGDFNDRDVYIIESIELTSEPLRIRKSGGGWFDVKDYLGNLVLGTITNGVDVFSVKFDGSDFVLADNILDTPIISAKQTVFSKIKSFVAGVLNSSKVKMIIKGLTLNQLLLFGDFRATTGWTVTANWNISGGIATYDGGGTNFIQRNIPIIINKKYLLLFDISNTIGINAKINITDETGATIFTEFTGYNSYGNGKHALILNSSDNANAMRIYSTSSGDVYELDNVMIIPITNTALDGLSLDEINDLQLPYFEGEVHSTPKIKTMTRNIFDKSSVVIGSRVNSTTGGLTVDDSAYTTDYMLVEKNVQYVFPLDVGEQSYSYYDINKIFISGNFAQPVPITIPSNVYYFRKSFKITNTDINTLQIEEGSEASEFVHYDEDILDPQIELLAVGNVSDTIQNIDENSIVLPEWEHRQKIKTSVLVEGDVIDYDTSKINFDAVKVSYPVDGNVFNKDNSINVEGFGSAIVDNTIWTNDDITGIGTILVGLTSSGYLLLVAKGTYADLATAKTALAGTVITYVLTEPIITLLPDLNELESYKGGRFEQLSVISTEFDYTVALNTRAVIKDNTEVINRLEKQVHNLEILPTIIDSKNYSVGTLQQWNDAIDETGIARKIITLTADLDYITLGQAITGKVYGLVWLNLAGFKITLLGLDIINGSLYIYGGGTMYLPVGAGSITVEEAQGHLVVKDTTIVPNDTTNVEITPQWLVFCRKAFVTIILKDVTFDTTGIAGYATNMYSVGGNAGDNYSLVGINEDNVVRLGLAVQKDATVTILAVV